MADILLYILVSVACVFGIVGLIYQIIVQIRKKREVDFFSNQMQYAVDQTTRELQKFFDLLKMKPTTQGIFGENIVNIVLSNLPEKYVKTQYQPRDVNGRIDFTVQLPNSDLILPIDSKFILPKDFENLESKQLDKLTIESLNKKTIRRAKEITKYVKSSETTDFVLMYLPDFVYSVLRGDTFQELALMKVVPTNTSGLLSTIFMVNMQYRFLKLSSAANRFGDLQVKVCQNVGEIIEKMKTSTSQLQFSMNNINDSINELSKLYDTLDTLQLDEIH